MNELKSKQVFVKVVIIFNILNANRKRNRNYIKIHSNIEP